jgi:hypothetical protein
MVIPLLEPLDIAAKTITADALLTQRKLAQYLIERNADFVFTVKGNQAILREDIRLLFADRGQPDFSEPLTLAHGRIEQRSIWTSTALNDYLDFPGEGPSLRHRTPHHREDHRRDLQRNRLRPHQPHPTACQRRRHSGLQPPPLECRERLPLHPRLELGRGSLHHPHRPRPREHHRATPLRHRRH